MKKMLAFSLNKYKIQPFHFSTPVCLETLFLYLFAWRVMVKGGSTELLKSDASEINNGRQSELLQARSFK